MRPPAARPRRRVEADQGLSHRMDRPAGDAFGGRPGFPHRGNFSAAARAKLALSLRPPGHDLADDAAPEG
jgi:hypothetical protein